MNLMEDRLNRAFLVLQSDVPSGAAGFLLLTSCNDRLAAGTRCSLILTITQEVAAVLSSGMFCSTTWERGAEGKAGVGMMDSEAKST